VLSLDEKTQIQAVDRTAPMLPLRPGEVERHTHDCKRNGTTSLFAALRVATGTVTTEARARHTGADFLAFLRRVGNTTIAHGLPAVVDQTASRRSESDVEPDVRRGPGRADPHAAPEGVSQSVGE